MLHARGRGTPIRPVLCSLLTLSAAGLPLEARGQSPTDMVLQFAESASGFTMTGNVERGALPAGRQLLFPLEMVTGSDYMIVGFCDPGCTDMDLAILDAQGVELESDILPDAQPVLLVTPIQSGGYQVRLDMVDCSTENCAYAVGVLQGIADGATFDLPGGTMDHRLAAFREDLVSEGFSEMSLGEQGTLEEDQEMRFPLPLDEGIQYRIVGVCDNDCGNMDLTLFDPEGQEVVADRLEDAFPVLRIPSPPTGEYRLAVSMVTCTPEPCSFRVAVFGEGPGLAPGGIVVRGEIVSRSTHHGALEAGDEQLREGEYFDGYTIWARAGQRILADLRSSDFDTYLILEPPTGEMVRNDDFNDDPLHSHIEMVAEEEGEYTILVTSYRPEATGRYVLQVAVVEGS